MPVEITPDDAYDDASDTLRVGRHDLERLLLEFRELMRHQEPRSWRHMEDYERTTTSPSSAWPTPSTPRPRPRRGARWEGS
ncbi:hypothetical protein [Streptomyces candidus]|uniref:Uncharacterized protein n=1 Tax=Streptomyces candidus TaxID=67283 RepID=A0A7X0HNQ8_9ACTN|nr:hypothetical protein [Streptomyces candidus]MBB6439538.1 hypothetical protein [Streptomyces candidus]